jgi:hypothetical protein
MAAGATLSLGFGGGYIAYIPIKQRERWAWICLAVGLGAWFVLDNGLSWQYGVSLNGVFNIVVALALRLPLVFSRKTFAGY